MFGHRFLRVSVAAGLMLAAGIALYPHVFSYVSTGAVVNAPVVTLRSPFDGVIAEPSGEISTAVAAGDGLVVVSEDRSDQHIINDLEARLMATSGRLAALSAQRAELRQLRDGLRQRVQAHSAHAGAWLEAREAEATARIEAAMARLSEAEADRDRQQRLASTGALTRVSLANAETQTAIAGSLVAAERANRSRLAVARQALEDGVPLDEGGEGQAHISSRLDDLDLQLVELEMQHAGLDAERRGLEMQIAFNAERLRNREVFTPEAQFSGVIWKASAPAGTPVLVGDELVRLLDCSKRFVEVAIDERHFERIAPGATARVRLKGSEHWLEAPVLSVIGSGSRIDRPAFGAEPPNLDDQQLSVFLGLPAADPDRLDVAQAFCDVGRTAEVRFHRHRKGVAETTGWIRKTVARTIPALGG